MALVLAVLSLLPVLVGFLTAGDFPQLVFKPPLWLVRVVFGSRYLLIALSVVLYLSAIIVHLLVAPTSIAFLIVIGVLVLVLTYGAFFAEPTLLCSTGSSGDALSEEEKHARAGRDRVGPGTLHHCYRAA